MVWRHAKKAVKRLGRESEGIAAVEFVLVLPLLLLMLFGTIELGRILVDYQLANKSVRDSIRYLSRVRDDAIAAQCPAGGQLWPSPAPAPTVTNAVNLAMTGSIADPAGPGDYLLGYWNDRGTIRVWVDCTDNIANQFSGAFQGTEYIPQLTMEAKVSFPSGFGWLLSVFDDFTITVTHNEVHIGD
jgi:hypothetical protein